MLAQRNRFVGPTLAQRRDVIWVLISSGAQVVDLLVVSPVN